MSNIFDQFDAVAEQSDTNPFDQFDSAQEQLPTQSPQDDIDLSPDQSAADLDA